MNKKLREDYLVYELLELNNELKRRIEKWVDNGVYSNYEEGKKGLENMLELVDLSE